MLTLINPADESSFGKLEEDTAGTVAEKVQRATEAQRKWALTPLEKRLQVLTRFNEALSHERERLARTLTQETGKPITQARNEVSATVERVRYFIDNAARALEPETVVAEGDTRERITHEPLGVVANISAWNYPYFVGTNVFVPALLMGNAVLYKPSEFAVLTGDHIAALLTQAGLPPDVFTVVSGGGAVGEALLSHPLAGVFFTGSYGTGLKVAAAAAPGLMKVQLELGGKDPVYVCEDVDVTKAAASLADGAFYNTGQSCCAVERIYVHHSIAKSFIARFVDTVRSFVVGDPTDESTYIGPLTRAAQLTVLDAQVRDAVAKGAQLQCGGTRLTRKGFYFAPTVLTDTTHAMQVMRDESFGPIIGLQSVQGDEEAVALMNDTAYGLTAGVFCGHETRAARILAQVNAGSAYWNCCDRVSPRLPWTGRKHSGMGSTLSMVGIRTFTQPKAWHLRNPG